MDETNVLDEMPAEEITQTEKKSRGGKHSKPGKNRRRGGKKSKKGLVIALCVIAALAIIAALFVFVVYGGRHMYLKAELGDGAPAASAFMKDGADASYGWRCQRQHEQRGYLYIKGQKRRQGSPGASYRTRYEGSDDRYHRGPDNHR